MESETWIHLWIHMQHASGPSGNEERSLKQNPASD
jgi:hypothetical protein